MTDMVVWKEVDGQKMVAIELYRELLARYTVAIDHVMELFSQGASYQDKNNPQFYYDHMCLSAYESAQDYLLELGMIKPEECSRK